ncbi:RagB/SusD family nutrient uptake outer membrane protein [Hymenobacter sp. BRD67]|uniref:RagB/SusD family nutrient uptake outer membrane protein n=1 Tax=Hymenobacter sp. BRD67 TaxID=2675877 RepID=UPI001563149B|nr:RagB/SusD family nutrient uptake outer membrane protein [Hymenobacter sp. BRD67]QKG51341.1 RagB/SusD family nutrient uptake outer membrane protein [Hymenobacter sp. BRD67]
MNISFKTTTLVLFGVLSLGAGSCSKFLEPLPQNSLSPSQVFADEAGATAALIGTYGALTSTSYLGVTYPAFADLAADNLSWTGTYPTWSQVKNHAILADNVDITNTWAAIYAVINSANNVIALTPGIASIPDSHKAQLVAEAQFLRAIAYFDLTRFWGDVPLVLTPTTGPGAALNVSTVPKAQVYDQIKLDLTAAETALPDVNVGRGTKWAAKALKARLALYRGQWQEASDLADQIIASGKFQLMPSYRSVFTTENSVESIWEVQFEATGNKSYEAFYMVPGSNGGRNEASPTGSGSTLPAAYEPGDTRKAATISDGTFLIGGAPAPAGVQIKYYQPSGEDNFRYIRYAEVLLTGAEAKAQLANTTGALTLLNQVRTRAGLAPSVATGTALLDAIAQERRVELALEGHRWFDLVRTGKAQQVLGITDPNRLLFPVPQRETQNNPNIKQNPGY